MKKLSLLIVFFTSISFIYAQENNNLNCTYGFNIYQSISGSGYGSNINLNTNVEQNGRLLAIGAIIQNDQMKLSGYEVRYKVFINHKQHDQGEFYSRKNILCPYIHYNLVHHRTDVSDQENMFTSAFPELNVEKNIITTMEHYAGFGLQLRLKNNFHFDSSIGGGVYLGSIYSKYNPIKTFGIHRENYGFVLSFKLGVGYRFS